MENHLFSNKYWDKMRLQIKLTVGKTLAMDTRSISINRKKFKLQCYGKFMTMIEIGKRKTSVSN